MPPISARRPRRRRPAQGRVDHAMMAQPVSSKDHQSKQGRSQWRLTPNRRLSRASVASVPRTDNKANESRLATRNGHRRCVCGPGDVAGRARAHQHHGNTCCARRRHSAASERCCPRAIAATPERWLARQRTLDSLPGPDRRQLRQQLAGRRCGDAHPPPTTASRPVTLHSRLCRWPLTATASGPGSSSRPSTNQAGTLPEALPSRWQRRAAPAAPCQLALAVAPNSRARDASTTASV